MDTLNDYLFSKLVNLLKIWAAFSQGFAMQPKPFFPNLPRNVSTAELRKEIRRRMEIADRLGLIRKPKK